MKSFYTNGHLVDEKKNKNSENNSNLIDKKSNKKKTKKDATDQLIANRMRANLRRRKLSIKECSDMNNHG